MGDWTTPVRWAGRGADEVAAGLSHDGRTDPEQQHANENIDPSRTPDNVTLVPDGAGGLRVGRIGEIRDAIDARVASCQNFMMVTDRKTGEKRRVNRGYRSDASRAVEAILALDPDVVGYVHPGWYPVKDEDDDIVKDENGDPVMEWSDGMTQEEMDRAVDLIMVEYDTLAEHFGEGNAMGLTFHLDEDRIHAHAWFVPRTPEGQLNFGAFFSNDPERQAETKTEAGQHYSALHDRIRENLRQAGYDATFERVSKGRKHLGPSGYKRVKADQAQAKHEARQAALEADKRAEAVRGREVALRVRERSLEARETAVQAREGDLGAWEAEVAQERSEARQERAAASAARQALEAQQQRAAKAAAEAERNAREVERTLKTLRKVIRENPGMQSQLTQAVRNSEAARKAAQEAGVTVADRERE